MPKFKALILLIYFILEVDKICPRTEKVSAADTSSPKVIAL
ncbi:hypothetical protein PPIS_b0877 [Pseudoalteromonas piscicida]|uniref:Uncharacterized protein n=1 Tax=Pseudoalteromonas piscicida TaxID=43662 RepID=A0ABN5CSM6_PSEO7|nr:hypothetical protein PPIS_b0877 [Pseudoalteromonas piscicida]